MRAFIDIIDWEYPAAREPWKPSLWDLADPDVIYRLILDLGNGVILELRAVADSDEALERLRGLFLGVGACEPISLTMEQRAGIWYYREGDECYRQPVRNPGYMMLDPVPRPELFAV